MSLECLTIPALQLRQVIRIAAVVLILLLFPAAGWAEVQLLEGFEDMAKVQVTGKTRPVHIDAPAAVTQGKHAARLPADVGVDASISAEAAAKFHWLRIDTMTLRPLPQALVLRFVGRDFEVALRAHVQPGSDTLALPLSVVSASAKASWPGEGVKVTVVNAAQVSLIVDNLRLETAVERPEGSTFIDFGPVRQAVWPGFDAGESRNENFRWGAGVVEAGATAMPDPLGCDYVGPIARSKASGSLTLTSRQKKSSLWMWVTHYGYSHTQPPEYAIRVGGRSILARSLSTRQALGPEGLLVGMDGAWTSKWFDSQYAGTFVSLVNFTIAVGQQIDLGNCQLAAMVIAPPLKRMAVERYIKTVESDISRYRRQFVLGYERRPLCQLAPLEQEDKAGAIILTPPADSRFLANWSPLEADRLTKLKILAANGDQIIASFAIVPLQPSELTTGSFSPPRSEKGIPLALEAGGLSIRFMQRVPRVRDSVVDFQPWVLTSRCPPLAPREIVFAVVTGRLNKAAQRGVYHSSLSLTVARRRISIPVELEVVDLGAEAVRPAVIGAMGAAHAFDYFRAVSDALPTDSRQQLTMRVRRQLLTDGLDSLRLSGVRLGNAGTLQSGGFEETLKVYPVSLARAPTLIEVQNAGLRLITGTKGRVSGLADAARSAIKQTVVLANKRLGSSDHSYVLWDAEQSLDDDDRMVAEAISSYNARPMVLCSSNAIRVLGAGAEAQLKPWSALLISPTSKFVAGQIAAFKKLGREKAVYVYARAGDRYLSGFYPAAVGADGCYVGGPWLTDGSPYDGFHVTGEGMLAVQADGTLAPTLALLHLWQGRSDADVIRRCQTILNGADKTSAAAKELDAVLKSIRDRSGDIAEVSFSPEVMRTTSVSPAELDAWRDQLLRAGAKLVAAGADKN